MALALLVAIATGVVLAAFAGARRTDAALPAMLRYHDAPDAYISFVPANFGSQTSPDLAPELATIRAIKGVREARRVTNAIISFTGVRSGNAHNLLADMSIDDGGVAMFGHPYVVHGRLPRDDVAEEIAVDEEAARDFGLHVGSVEHIQAFTPEQADEILAPGTVPKGIAIDARVTAIVRYPTDLRDLQTPKHYDNIYATHYNAYLTAALWRKSGGDLFQYNPSVLVRLERGTSFADLRRAVGQQFSSTADVLDRGQLLQSGGTFAGVSRAVSLQSRALQAFGALATVVALLLVGQALGRQIRVEGADDPVLRAVGTTPAQLRVAVVLRSGVVAATGAVVGLAVALALSAWTPLPGSTARRAVRHPGVAADWTVLLGGALVVIVLVTLVATVSGLMTGRRESEVARRPRLAARAAALGVALPGVIGMRFALEPGRGRRSVPVRAALATSVLAVVVVLGAGVFASSLHTLRHDPHLYGVTWDAAVGGASSKEESNADLGKLREISGITAYSGIGEAFLDVNGHNIATLFVQATGGRITPRIVDGRAPTADDEIVLGGDTMKQAKAHVGGTVKITPAGQPPVTFRVVGRAVMNASGIDTTFISLGKGALADWNAGYKVLSSDVTDEAAPQSWLVRIASGADRNAVIGKLHEAFPTTTVITLEPPDLQNLGDVVGLPFAFALVVALLGVGTIAHALVSAVRRRGRDLAMLKTLGFARGQVRSVITAQAMTFGVIAIVLGIPLGIAAGRAAWGLAASQLGVVDRAIVPLPTIVLGCLSLLAAMLLVALVPARMARRVSVATALRRD